MEFLAFLLSNRRNSGVWIPRGLSGTCSKVLTAGLLRESFRDTEWIEAGNDFSEILDQLTVTFLAVS